MQNKRVLFEVVVNVVSADPQIFIFSDLYFISSCHFSFATVVKYNTCYVNPWLIQSNTLFVLYNYAILLLHMSILEITQSLLLTL